MYKLLVGLVALVTVADCGCPIVEVSFTAYLKPYNGGTETCIAYLTNGDKIKKCGGGCDSSVRFDAVTGSSSNLATPDTTCMAKLNCCNPTTLTTKTGVAEFCENTGFTMYANRKITYPSACVCGPCYGAVSSSYTEETSETSVTVSHCTP